HEAKKAKMLEEYNSIFQRADPLQITNISYTVDSHKNATMRITRAKFQWVLNQANKVGLPPPSELATFRMTNEDKKQKRTEFFKEIFMTEYIRVDGMNKNLITPSWITLIDGLVINKPESVPPILPRNLMKMVSCLEIGSLVGLTLNSEKGKGVATNESQLLILLLEKGGSTQKPIDLKELNSQGIKMSLKEQPTNKAKMQEEYNREEHEAKKAKMLEEYNSIFQRADPLQITNISYTVDSHKNATMRITRVLGKISKTRYSVVDDETMQWLKDTIAKQLIEELGKLMNEIVNIGMTANHGVVVKTRMQNIPKFGGEDVKGWLFQIEQFFKDNNIPDEGKVNLISSNNSWRSGLGDLQRGTFAKICHYDVNLEKNEGAHKMFDEMSTKGKGFEVYDAYVKEWIEVGNRVLESVVVETAKADVEVENVVVDDDIKVKTSKSVDSKFRFMKVDRFVTDKNISKLHPHNNNGSLVRTLKGFHLLGMYVDKGYVEGWEDEDKYLNIFDYDCEVYDLSTKALLGEKGVLC
nr:hypothetical protein [Tanacetum cinerariifolium]